MQMQSSFLVTLVLILSSAISTFSQSQRAFTFGGAKDEIGYDVLADDDGTLLILSSDRTVTKGSEDICLLKINTAKNISQRRCFGSDKQDYPHSLIRTSDGGVAIAGTRWNKRRDAYLLKLNANLEIEWETFYDGGAHHHDEGFTAIETRDGGYILTGMTKSSRGVTRGSMLLLKISAAGEQEWVVHEEVTSKNYLFDVLEDRDGNLVSVGVESGHNRYSEFEFYRPSATGIIYKHDPDGVEIWRQLIGGRQNDWISDVVEAPGGGYYLLGSTQSLGSGSFDFYLVKVNQDGELEWEQTYGDAQFDYGRQLEILENGDLLILGTVCLDSENFNTDVLLLRTDYAGSELWREIYGGMGSEIAQGMSITNDLVHIVGEVEMVEGGDTDIMLLEVPLNGTVDADEYSNENNRLLVYPNPASHSVSFDLINFTCGDFRLMLYDQLGRMVHAQNHQAMQQIILDLTSWPRGTYFYSLTSGCYATVSGKLQKN